MTKPAAEEIAKLDPYKFMAVIGKRVIHPGGRASTDELLARAHVIRRAACSTRAAASPPPQSRSPSTTGLA